MKSRTIIVVFVLLTVSLALAGEQKFSKGRLFLIPQFTYYSYAPNLGVSMEYSLTENIGIGASFMIAFWSTDLGALGKTSESLITPSLDAYYHFTKIGVKKIDLFAGLSLGYSIYSWSWDLAGSKWGEAGTSSFYLSPTLGVRYYLTQKLALCLKSHLSAIGDWAGIGGELGLSINLNK